MGCDSQLQGLRGMWRCVSRSLSELQHPQSSELRLGGDAGIPSGRQQLVPGTGRGVGIRPRSRLVEPVGDHDTFSKQKGQGRSLCSQISEMQDAPEVLSMEAS